MSFTDGKEVNVVGSMSLRSQVYAGDYDAYEKVSFKGTKTLIVKRLVNKFKSIIKSIHKFPLTYYSYLHCLLVLNVYNIIYCPSVYNHI